jgi:hypothetical protein
MKTTIHRLIVPLLAILTVILYTGCGQDGQENRSSSSSAHKSARQLIIDYGKAQYGNDADVSAEGPMYGDTYQVLVRKRIVGGQNDGGVDDFNINAKVNVSAQEVTSWEVVGHN